MCIVVRKDLEQTLPKTSCPGHAVVGKVCLVTSPKDSDSLCLHLVVIDCIFLVRKASPEASPRADRARRLHERFQKWRIQNLWPHACCISSNHTPNHARENIEQAKVDAGHQCRRWTPVFFCVVAQATLQDSPKASPRVDRARGRKTLRNSYTRTSIQDTDGLMTCLDQCHRLQPFFLTKVIFTGLPRKTLTLNRQRWTLDTSVDAGHQCFSVVAQATLQDSPKASPRADRARGRKTLRNSYTRTSIQDMDGLNFKN